MIITGTTIRKAIRNAIKDLIAPIPVYSIMPPDSVKKYVIIEELAQNAIDEKRAFITEGFISISCIEKFTGRDGDFDEVNAIAKQIQQVITPDRLSTFGFTDGIDIFTMNFDAVTEGMFETEPGRTAVVSLRLRYMAQNQ